MAQRLDHDRRHHRAVESLRRRGRPTRGASRRARGDGLRAGVPRDVLGRLGVSTQCVQCESFWEGRAPTDEIGSGRFVGPPHRGYVGPRHSRTGSAGRSMCPPATSELESVLLQADAPQVWGVSFGNLWLASQSSSPSLSSGWSCGSQRGRPSHVQLQRGRVRLLGWAGVATIVGARLPTGRRTVSPDRRTEHAFPRDRLQ
jgi:hypothetical protein